VLTHYTWSKTLNYANTYYNIDARLAYGPNDNHRHHVFLLANLFELPFGRGRRFMNGAPKGLDLLAGGWQINSLFSWQSGLPFTPSYRDCNADRDTGWCRPDLIGEADAVDPSQFGWFATSDVPLTANGQVNGPWRRPQRGTFGSVGRNRLFGPHFSQWDLSFFKTFNVSERFRVQFRAESYNFANVVNLGQPNGCVDCPGVAGRIFNTFQLAVQRQWQFATRLEF
jgi:hypothetical protein